jgi:hypothetical protein
VGAGGGEAIAGVALGVGKLHAQSPSAEVGCQEEFS